MHSLTVIIISLLISVHLSLAQSDEKSGEKWSECQGEKACYQIGCDMCNTPYMYECCPEYCLQQCSGFEQYKPDPSGDPVPQWGNGQVPRQDSGPTPSPDLGALFSERIMLNRKNQLERTYLPGEEPTGLSPANSTKTRGEGDGGEEEEAEGTAGEETDGECPRPDFSPCISDQEAGKRVDKCCNDPGSGIDPGCAKYCKTHSITTSKMLKMRNDGNCDLDKSGRPFLECFSEGNDVTDCCKYKGVPNYCISMCDPNGNWPALDIKIFENCKPLDPTLEKIADCYQAYQN